MTTLKIPPDLLAAVRAMDAESEKVDRYLSKYKMWKKRYQEQLEKMDYDDIAYVPEWQRIY